MEGKKAYGVPVGTRELVGLAAAGEDDDGDINVTENGELASFLDQSGAAFGEGDLTATLVFDSLHLHLPPPHSQAILALESDEAKGTDTVLSNSKEIKRHETVFTKTRKTKKAKKSQNSIE
ncbi:hypothetical protein SLA2020_130820 [Shorea laevis]